MSACACFFSQFAPYEEKKTYLNTFIIFLDIELRDRWFCKQTRKNNNNINIVWQTGVGEETHLSTLTRQEFEGRQNKNPISRRVQRICGGKVKKITMPTEDKLSNKNCYCWLYFPCHFLPDMSEKKITTRRPNTIHTNTVHFERHRELWKKSHRDGTHNSNTICTKIFITTQELIFLS